MNFVYGYLFHSQNTIRWKDFDKTLFLFQIVVEMIMIVMVMCVLRREVVLKEEEVEAEAEVDQEAVLG